MQLLETGAKLVLDSAWNMEAAQSNLERWLDVCEKEAWGQCPQNLSLLVKLFGASWFFTRFVFFRGNQITHFFDNPIIPDCSIDNLQENLLKKCTGDALDKQLDCLRIAKSEVMLQIVLAYLAEQLDQEQTEKALSNLAEAVLWCTLQLLDKGTQHKIWKHIAILAMGRLAGQEMNFGSDLDLIILFPEALRSESEIIIKQVQRLMRNIAEISPYGTLYEVDMRLRPYGSSGTLVSSAQYFVDYHNSERAIWERQMMTRCRAVIDNNNLATESLDAIKPVIYSKYPIEHLRTEIMQMRKKAQEELGSPKDKYEIKRGEGGIMDIDFITHYLQLLHGWKQQSLQTPSTRQALRKLNTQGLLDGSSCQELIEAYNYLKRIEGALRMFDMKSISAFSKQPAEVYSLARAMGYFNKDMAHSSELFLENYLDIVKNVRQKFIKILGELD